MHCSKHITTACATGPLQSAMTASFNLNHQLPIESTVSLDYFALGAKDSTSCEAEYNTALKKRYKRSMTMSTT